MNSGLLISERTTPFFGDFYPLPHSVNQVTTAPYVTPGEHWPCAHLFSPTMGWKTWATDKKTGISRVKECA